MSNLTTTPSTKDQAPDNRQAPSTENRTPRSMEWPVERNRKTARERLQERTAKRANLIDLLRNVKAVCEKAGFTFEDLLRDV